MKILTTGTPQPDQAPWWIGKQPVCGNCGCKVELEQHDVETGVVTLFETTYSTPARLSVACPNAGCGVDILLSQVR